VYVDAVHGYGMRRRDDDHDRMLQIIADKPSPCLYCGNAEVPGHRDRIPRVKDVCGGTRAISAGTVFRACACGWWNFLEFIRLTVGYDRPPQLSRPSPGKAYDYECMMYHTSAIVKRFSIASLDVPLDALRKYLEMHYPDVRSIHPRKMEELVADVFRDHFACDVALTGRGADGGIDLIILEADAPIIVEVKRRTRMSAEAVGVVRALIGVMVREQVRHGMVVSTADRFSETAKREANSVGLGVAGMDVRLLDYHQFEDVLRGTGIMREGRLFDTIAGHVADIQLHARAAWIGPPEEGL